MTSKWRKTLVGDAFEVNPARPLKRGSVAPFIPMDALPQHARAIERIESREYTGSGTRFRNGDTLIARITPCLENGKTAFVSGLQEDEVAHGSTEYIVLGGKEDETNSLFGYYLARSPEFRRYAIGHMEGTSGRQRVPSSAIEKYAITLPPLEEQHAIVHILGVLDDRIELNRRMNQTLEAMARALFKSWFVDFDGEESFEESELGLIPKQWKWSTLGSECSYLNRGISPKYIENDGVLVINQKCIRDLSIDISKARRHDPTQRSVEGRQIQIGDVLINSTGVGTLGRVAQVLSVDEPTIVDSHVTVVRAGQRLNWTYLGQWFSDKQSKIEAMGEGSTGQTELSRLRLARMPILIPPQKLLADFDTVVSPLKAKISLADSSSRCLVKLRDALLPKLISGELRIRDAERFVGEAT